MQDRVDRLIKSFEGLGLEINPKKCHLLHLSGNKKCRISYIWTSSICTVNGALVPIVEVCDKFKYLGVDFNHRGIMASSLDPCGWLDQVDHAPLKPYCKYKILCKFLIPRLHYTLTFCKFSKKELVGYDKNVRAKVRKWLQHSHSVSNDAIHMSISEGGIGVPSTMAISKNLKESRLLNVEGIGGEEDGESLIQLPHVLDRGSPSDKCLAAQGTWSTSWLQLPRSSQDLIGLHSNPCQTI